MAISPKINSKLIVIMLTGIFFLSFILYNGSASSSCNEDQVIFRLSSETNAHGELFNIGNYPVDVCYSSIFGVDFEGDNPRICKENNELLKLSSETNAHGAFSEDTTYNQSVCYGNLICEVKSTCSASEKAVVSLSSGDNAHIALGDSYNNVVCCSLPDDKGDDDNGDDGNETNGDDGNETNGDDDNGDTIFGGGGDEDRTRIFLSQDSRPLEPRNESPVSSDEPISLVSNKEKTKTGFNILNPIMVLLIVLIILLIIVISVLTAERRDISNSYR